MWLIILYTLAISLLIIELTMDWIIGAVITIVLMGFFLTVVLFPPLD
uniref:Uncharacterized protein n=1 Tax=Siphoviridae sp. cthu813 TaxID=2825618 RepID=A0A8S5VIA4_9CAUD|nr:MAG TPA: hypothetical protein [Siphoviridae sp. cthu813]